MVLYGTLINGLCIVLGSVIGLFFTKIPERIKETIMSGIALTVMVIGLKMGFTSDDIVVILLSLLSGALIGEGIQLEDKFEKFGAWIEAKFKQKSPNSSIAQGFITASLIFVIGSMAVIGALYSGLRGDHSILITKAFIDGFVALVLTTTLGFGVVLSVIPVILYEGSIALLATKINEWLSEDFLNSFIDVLTSTGGILIFAIGLNLLNITKIRIANLLPSLLTVGFILYFSQLIKAFF